MISNSTGAQRVSFESVQQVFNETVSDKSSSGKLTPEKGAELREQIINLGSNPALDKAQRQSLISMIDQLAKSGISDKSLTDLRLSLQSPSSGLSQVEQRGTAPLDAIKIGTGEAPKHSEGVINVGTNIVGGLMEPANQPIWEVAEGAPIDMPVKVESFGDHLQVMGHYLSTGNLQNGADFFPLLRNLMDAIQPGIKAKILAMPEHKRADIGADDIMRIRSELFSEALEPLSVDQRMALLKALFSADMDSMYGELCGLCTKLEQESNISSDPSKLITFLFIKDMRGVLESLKFEVIDVQHKKGEISDDDLKEINQHMAKIVDDTGTTHKAALTDLHQSVAAKCKEKVDAPINGLTAGILAKPQDAADFGQLATKMWTSFANEAHATEIGTASITTARSLLKELAPMSVADRDAVLASLSTPAMNEFVGALADLKPMLDKLSLDPRKLTNDTFADFSDLMVALKSSQNPAIQKILAPYADKLAALDPKNNDSLQAFYQGNHFIDVVRQFSSMAVTVPEVIRDVKMAVYSNGVIDSLKANPINNAKLKENLATLRGQFTGNLAYKESSEWLGNALKLSLGTISDEQMDAVLNNLPSAHDRQFLINLSKRMGVERPGIRQEQAEVTKLFLRNNIDTKLVKIGLGARIATAFKNFFRNIFGGDYIDLQKEQLNQKMVTFARDHHNKLHQLITTKGVTQEGIEGLVKDLMKEVNPKLSAEDCAYYASNMVLALYIEEQKYETDNGKIHFPTGSLASYGPSMTCGDAVHELFSQISTGAPDFADINATLQQIMAFGKEQATIQAAFEKEFSLLDKSAKELLAERIQQPGCMGPLSAIWNLKDYTEMITGNNLMSEEEQLICSSKFAQVATDNSMALTAILSGLSDKLNIDLSAVTKPTTDVEQLTNFARLTALGTLDTQRTKMGELCEKLLDPKANIGSILADMAALGGNDPDHYLDNFADFFNAEIKADVMPGFSAKALTSADFTSINKRIAKFAAKHAPAAGSVEEKALKTLQEGLNKVQHTVVARDIKEVPANINELAFKVVQDIIGGKTGLDDFEAICKSFSDSAYDILQKEAAASGSFIIGLEDYSNLITSSIEHTIEGLSAEEKEAFVAKMDNSKVKSTLHKFLWAVDNCLDIARNGLYDSKAQKEVLKEGIGITLQQKTIVIRSFIALVDEAKPGYQEAIDGIESEPSAKEIGKFFDNAVAIRQQEMMQYAAKMMRGLTSGSEVTDEILQAAVDLFIKSDAPQGGERNTVKFDAQYLFELIQHGEIPGFKAIADFEPAWGMDFQKSLGQKVADTRRKMDEDRAHLAEIEPQLAQLKAQHEAMPKTTAEEKEAAGAFYRTNVSPLYDERDRYNSSLSQAQRQMYGLEILDILASKMVPVVAGRKIF